jgi:polar amino acid transport system permease protein
VAAIWYLVCTSVLTVFQSWIERKYSPAIPGTPGWASRMFAFRFGRKEHR